MINLTYKGQNYIIFGNIKIRNGVNSIPEEDFYRLMKDQFFRARLEKGIFTVPQGTKLEPTKTKKAEEKPAEVEEVKDSKKKTKEKESENRFDEIK